MRKSVGYSGTPLAKKLGIKPGGRLALVAAPREYRQLVEPLPAAVCFQKQPGATTDIVHLFVTRVEDLGRHLVSLRKSLRSDAVVWVSWPKKASGVPSTVDEQSIRDLALPLGLVDVKVCAVTDVWSGLKLVVRTSLR